MGAWGTGPFENDGAADFLDVLQSSPGRSVAHCLRTIVNAPPGSNIEVDMGSAGWACCELVSLSFGFGDTSELVDLVINVLDRLRPKEELRQLAIDALPRIADPEHSELAALWHEGDLRGAFDQQIADLGERLEAAASGPKPIRKAKSGDIIGFPVGSGSDDLVIVQVIASGEIAVFDGAHRPDAVDGVVATGNARRVPAWVNRLLRQGEQLASAPIQKTLKGRKLYASESGAISDYCLMTASGGGYKSVSFEEARRHDIDRLHDLSAIRAVASGQLAVGRVRSPDEREADIRTRNSEKWASRRASSSPGPFGDEADLEDLVKWIEEYSLENAILRFTELATGAQAYGRPNESAERRPYALAGLTALWLDKWPIDDWPSGLAGRLPACPDKRLLAAAVAAARILIDQVITRDAELRLIWDNGPDKGAELRATVASLREALA